jgi:adenylate cyclase
MQAAESGGAGGMSTFAPAGLRRIAGFVLVLAAALAAQELKLAQSLEYSLLDREFTLLREQWPRPAPNDVVVVGIDEKSLTLADEPFALWHPHLGRFFAAMAAAQPSVLGVDIVLPPHSYHALLPGYDQKLLAGLEALRDKVPLVLAQTVDEQGNFRRIFTSLAALAGDDAFGSVVMCADEDNAVRRYGGTRCDANAKLGRFAERAASRLGRQGPWQGWIDYTLGGTMSYVPFHQVMQWVDKDPAMLRSTFGGRPVLLGVILRFEDRVRVPVPLAAQEPLRLRVPGVMLQAQVLRSMLNKGLIQAAAAPLQWALLLTAALFWFGHGWLKAVALAVYLPALYGLALLLLWQGVHLEIAVAVLASFAAYLARFGYEAFLGRHQRRFLREVFANYVSPPVLRQILAGKIKPALGGARRQVTVLYSDIREFTRRSGKLQPEESIELLNEYFSEMSAAVLQHGGSVNKFMGDGLMAVFGAPQALASPEKNALEAAQEMLLRLARLNQSLEARGREPLRVGIGLASGEAVLGHVGTHTLHEYTAIGDPVGAASRLEAMTRGLDYPILCDARVAEAVGAAGGLVDLGQPQGVRVYGWIPPLLRQRAV